MRNTARYMLIVLLLLSIAAISTAQTTTTPDATQFTLQPVVDGFNRALYVTHAGDGTDRMFMVQQNGIIHVIEDGSVLTTPFLDASGLISTDALGNGYTERGLLGLAFHPDYADNGVFFINYTELSSNDTIVARFTVSEDDPNVANPNSADIIFRTAQPYANHNGGHIEFGPEGFLYISVGDGGSAGDPLNSGQQPDTLLGTILRINVNGGLPYAIPESNPFVGNDFAADEVWAYGLRNVWRFSFDRETGDMYLGDVGQNRWEEVNFQPAGVGGQNYGWNILEGNNPFSGAAIPDDLTAPIAEYQHINGN
ncbi:MAG: PQQ-dependent sugar dehydrogenase, partial [Chloroflexota bacterium]